MKKGEKYHIFELNINLLNIFSIVLLVIMILITLLINKNLLIDAYLQSKDLVNLCYLLIIYFGFAVIHELLHYFAYIIYGAKKEKLVLGAALEKGILYCLCKQDINRKNILNSLMFPLFYLGIILYIISLIFNLKTLLIVSILNISGCIGDVFMFIYIVKLKKNIVFSEYDSETSFAIKSDYDISKIKHIGIKYLGTENNINRTIEQKIKISKVSLITFTFLLIIFLVLTLIKLFL